MNVRQWLQVAASVGLVVSGVVVGRSANAGVCPSSVEASCTSTGCFGGAYEDCQLVYQGTYCSIPAGQNQFGCNGAGGVVWGGSVNTNGAGAGNLSSGNWVQSGGSGSNLYLKVNQGQSTAPYACNIYSACQNLCTMAEGFTTSWAETCYIADTTDDGTSVFNSDGSCSSDSGQTCSGNCAGSYAYWYEQEFCTGINDP